MSARRDHPDAGAPLLRALLADAAATGCVAHVTSADARDWASSTYVGQRHRIVLTVVGAQTAAWLARLPEVDLPLGRHIVADIGVDRVEQTGDEYRITLAVLTLLAA